MKTLYIKKPGSVPGCLVRMEGLEPTCLAALDPKSSASTNFATSARFLRPFYAGLLKRVGKVMDYCRIEKEPTHLSVRLIPLYPVANGFLGSFPPGFDVIMENDTLGIMKGN